MPHSVRRLATRGRVYCLCGVFAVQLAAAYSVRLRSELPKMPDLEAVPGRIGHWDKQQESTLDPDVLELLRPDEFISRTYVRGDRNGTIDMFAAYFRSNEGGAGPHSPRVCLPGSGWREIANTVREIPVPAEGTSVPVNEYFLEKGDRRILVFYWYQNKRHIWAEEFRAKLYILPDLIAHRRSDLAMVRLVYTLEKNTQDVDGAREAMAELLRGLYVPLKQMFALT